MATASTEIPPRNERGQFTKADGSDPNANQPIKETPKSPLKSDAIIEFATDLLTGDKPIKKEKKNEGDKNGDQGDEAKGVKNTAKGADKSSDKAASAKPADKKAEKSASEKKTDPAPPAQPLTAEHIEALARGVASAMTKKDEKQEEQKAPENPDADLPETEQRRLTVLRYLEKSKPEKYKGVADKYKANLKKIEEYAEKWQKEHPGQEYNPEDEEHTDFYENNDLFEPWDAEDFTDAKAEIIAEKRISERDAALNKRLSTLEREKKALEAKPEIDRHQVAAAQNYWNLIGGEFDGLVLANGQLDITKAKKLQESDPDIYTEVISAASRLDTLIESAYLLKKGLVDYQPNNATHAYLGKFAIDKERQMMQRPPEKQLDATGRKFRPANEYFALPEGERERFWTFDEKHLAALLSADNAFAMKAFITAEEDKFNRRAKARGLAPKDSLLDKKEGKSADATADNTEKQTESNAEDVAKDNEETERSPSSAASPKSASAADAAKKTSVTGAKSWLADF